MRTLLEFVTESIFKNPDIFFLKNIKNIDDAINYIVSAYKTELELEIRTKHRNIVELENLRKKELKTLTIWKKYDAGTLDKACIKPLMTEIIQGEKLIHNFLNAIKKEDEKLNTLNKQLKAYPKKTDNIVYDSISIVIPKMMQIKQSLINSYEKQLASYKKSPNSQDLQNILKAKIDGIYKNLYAFEKQIESEEKALAHVQKALSELTKIG